MPPFADPPATESAWLDPDAPDVVALVVAELASSRQARQLVATLARDAGLSDDAAWDALLYAERGGWCECWPEDPDGPSAILSARSAGRLGLHLSRDGSAWLSPGDPDPSLDDRVRGGPSTETDLSGPDPDGPGLLSALADPTALEGLDSLLWLERLAREAAALEAEQQASPPPPANGLAKVARAWRGFGDAMDLARLSGPRLILGLAPAWPVAWDGHDAAACPGCGGRRLTLSSYCTICHRSGLDRILPAAAGAPADPPEDAPVPVADRSGRVKGRRSAKPARFRDVLASNEAERREAMKRAARKAKGAVR